MVDRQTIEASCAELLRRVTQRDHAALGELYDHLAGPVYSFAMQTLGDRREAEEVVQDVFLQIWNRAATFDGTLGTVFNWALGITRNRCIDYLRSRQRRSRLLDQASEEAVGESVLATKETLGAEELAAVRHAVESLPPDQHQAIALAFFGGMTHQEIAQMLNEPLGTIKARIRRGMLKLRDSLQDFL
jgi:RNA polymerase sigma-70 factor (ECF subfamily)